MTPKGNPTLRNNSSNPAPNVPTDPDSDPSLSDYSLSDSYDSPDGEYSKQRRCTKKNENNCQSKNIFNDPIKKCAKLISKLPTASQK